MIIDAHTHFYDPFRPEGVRWPPVDDEVIYRTVLPEHFKAVAASEGVVGTVAVAASSWLEDNQWVLDLAVWAPIIVGFVGYLDVGADDFVVNLERFSSNPLFRGIRVFRRDLEGLSQDAFVACMEELVSRDLSLDVVVFEREDFRRVFGLASSLPELRIVINHFGTRRIDGETPDSGWVEVMGEASEFSNVFCKVSGLAEMSVVSPMPAYVEFFAPVLDVLWDCFGEDRLVFGSNWPPLERGTDYATVKWIVESYFSAKGQVAVDKVFRRNSKVVYKWVSRK